MKTLLLLAVPAALSLAACAIPSPSSVGSSNAQLQARLAQFCAADFMTANTAALTEWIMIYNLVAPLVDREPIAAGAITESEAAMNLTMVRSAVCLATMPAPVAVEAVAEADVSVAADGEIVAVE